MQEMTGANQSTRDSPDAIDDDAVRAAEVSAKQGSSLLKLAGIAVGLTLVAAIIVAAIFWQTLNENKGQQNTLIEASESLETYDEPSDAEPAVEAEVDPAEESNATPQAKSAD
jgi:hypothetical protein